MHQPYPVVRRFLSVFVLFMFPIGAFGQADAGTLIAALNGKAVASTVTIGYQASTKNPVTVNGRPAMFPVKTQIYYPDGHEFFRIESGILHADADRYTTFKSETLFQITKVEAKSDCLEIDMAVSINSTVPDPKLKAGVKLMLGKGWQQSMTTEAVLAVVGTYLPDTAALAKAKAAEDERRAVDAQQARDAAEQARIAAEKVRAEEQARAEALTAKRQAESEKKIDATLLSKANAGDGEAQYLVGKVYYDGASGIEKDDAHALYWFRKSAEQGNAKGENALGVSYEYGSGVGKDSGQAVVWLRKAADQRNPKAEDNLGDIYYNGWGVQKDLSQALDWYRKSAAQGYSNAQYSLGYMFANGEGVKQDFAQAALWYRKAADQGNDNAQNNLGFLYERGEGVVQSNAMAKSWYSKASNQGNALAKSNLANLGKAAELAAHPPQVTGEDGFNIFRDQIYDYERYHLSDMNREINPVSIHPYDAHNEVAVEFRQSGSDQQKALLLALIIVRADVNFTPKDGNAYSKQFDGADLADVATSEAVGTYHYELYNAETEAQRNVDGLNSAVKKFSDWQVTYKGKNVTVANAIASIANDLLRSAYSGPHRTGDLTTFITGYIIPSGEGTPFAQARTAAITLGLK